MVSLSLWQRRFCQGNSEPSIAFVVSDFVAICMQISLNKPKTSASSKTACGSVTERPRMASANGLT
jgi:hypothetical protein